MKKISLIVVAVMVSLASLAQYQENTANTSLFDDSNEDVGALVKKVDSLEQELSRLKIDFKLSEFNNNLQIFKNSIELSSHDILLAISNRNFAQEYYEIHEKDYELNLEILSEYEERLSNLKLSFKKLETSSVVEEFEISMQLYNIRYLISSIKTSLELNRTYIDQYKKFL